MPYTHARCALLAVMLAASMTVQAATSRAGGSADAATVTRGDTPGGAALPLANATWLDLHTEQAGTGSRDYRIRVSWPDTPPPAQGWPVLYLLDADDRFHTVTETWRARSRLPVGGLQAGIVVGIGYPGESRRGVDYTPPAPPPPPREQQPADGNVYPAGEHGGADRFLAFIEQELKPLVATRWPVDPARQVLFGHSYGGLFTLHVLLTQPQAFQTYIASSPSIWWHERHILGETAGLAERLDRLPGKPRLLLTVGSLEQSLSPWEAALPPAVAQTRMRHNRARQMLDNVQALGRRLDSDGLSVDVQVLADESHMSAVLPAIGRALPFAFTAPQAPAPDTRKNRREAGR